MSDDLRRRRRITPNGPRRSNGGNTLSPWMFTIVAAFVVIVGGWFLGQGLAHWLSPKQQTAQAPTPAPVVTPLPSPTEAVAAATPSASPAASATPEASPTAAPTATPARALKTAPPATPTIAPTVAPTPKPTIAPTVAPATPAPKPRTILPVARRTEPTPAVQTVAENNPAASTVRSYIEALRRGDPQSAATYLGNGVPDEDFIDAQTRITSLNSTRNSDGSYKVAVDMQTGKGEYYETFIVAGTGTGTRILDKTAIKP
jgi:cytoskeletal protein RodZ